MLRIQVIMSSQFHMRALIFIAQTFYSGIIIIGLSLPVKQAQGQVWHFQGFHALLDITLGFQTFFPLFQISHLLLFFPLISFNYGRDFQTLQVFILFSFLVISSFFKNRFCSIFVTQCHVLFLFPLVSKPNSFHTHIFSFAFLSPSHSQLMDSLLVKVHNTRCRIRYNI